MKNLIAVATVCFVGHSAFAGESLIVVDSTGKTVGPYDSGQVVVTLRQSMLASANFSLKNGFDVQQRNFAYTTQNCSGTRYVFYNASTRPVMYAQAAMLPKGASFVYPIPSKAESLSISSADGVDPAGNYMCFNVTPPESIVVTPPDYTPVSSLGTPPFAVKIQP